MIYALLLSFTLHLGFAGAPADSLTLESSAFSPTPAMHTPDTVSFTFNVALDTSVHYRQTGPLGFWQILPADSAVIDSVWFSEDLRSVRYLMDHRTRSDYTWVLENARSADSLYLQRPYEVFYSLRPETVERYRISGEATTIAPAKRKGVWDNPSLSSIHSDTLEGPALTYDYLTVALLRQKPPALSKQYDVRSTQTIYAVSAADNDPFQYTISNIPTGIYWPVLLYRGSRGTSINGTQYYAFYDPNYSDDPDSIVVDHNLDHIDIKRTNTSIEDEPRRITAFKVSVYPNPFNNQTMIRLDVDRPGRYAVELINLTGRKIRTVTEAKLATGRHRYRLDMSGLSTGLYFVIVRSGWGMRVQKINYIK